MGCSCFGGSVLLATRDEVPPSLSRHYYKRGLNRASFTLALDGPYLRVAGSIANMSVFSKPGFCAHNVDEVSDPTPMSTLLIIARDDQQITSHAGTALTRDGIAIVVAAAF